MVHQTTRERTPVNKEREPKAEFIVFVSLMMFLVATVTIVVGFFIRSMNASTESTDDSSQEKQTIEEKHNDSEAETNRPVKVDYQTIVDSWATGINGKRSVLIYDPKLDEIVGEYNPDDIYNTASLYKLFVVYEGYRRLENGEWKAQDPVGSTGRTVLECLDLAIRESNSPCAESLMAKIGIEELNRIIKEDFEITKTNISSLTSTPSDILKIMKIFYEHKDIHSETLIAKMKDSFLNQPATTYNWRQGLPSGFSQANVYDKVGWDYNPRGFWNIYHDAAIVEFADENRDFIVVVMTNEVDYHNITELGKMIEKTFYNVVPEV